LVTGLASSRCKDSERERERQRERERDREMRDEEAKR